MRSQVDDISRKIKERARSTEKRAREIREERRMIQGINKDSFTGEVTGVDGGLINKSLHGANLVITRACAAQMKYKEDKLIEHSYYPDPSPELSIRSTEPKRTTKKPNLLRAMKEIDTAIQSLKNSSCNYLLLDGSIVPSPNDRPSEENQEEQETYFELIDKYQELFDTAEEKGTQVVGVIEDSKSRKISKKHGEGILDSILLHYVLNKKERTKSFNYSDEPGKHPVLTDFTSKTSNKIKAMYLKLAENDRPLRIEFLEGERDPEEISIMINSLSSISSDYSYPAPLIESDLHAKIKKNEANAFIDEVKSSVGEEPFLMEKRRDKRPFK